MQAVRSLWNRGVASGRLRAVPGAEFAVFGASVAVLLHALLSSSSSGDLTGGQWRVLRRAIGIGGSGSGNGGAKRTGTKTLPTDAERPAQDLECAPGSAGASASPP